MMTTPGQRQRAQRKPKVCDENVKAWDKVVTQERTKVQLLLHRASMFHVWYNPAPCQISRRADRVRWGMVAVLIVAFAVRVSSLTYQSLWRDEVRRIEVRHRAVVRVTQHIQLASGLERAIVFCAAARMESRSPGEVSFALRYFSLLAGVVAVALAFALARRLSHRLAAFLCALLFALSPYFICTARNQKCTPSSWHW